MNINHTIRKFGGDPNSLGCRALALAIRGFDTQRLAIQAMSVNTRQLVDLHVPYLFGWDAAGNRLPALPWDMLARIKRRQPVQPHIVLLQDHFDGVDVRKFDRVPLSKLVGFDAWAKPRQPLAIGAMTEPAHGRQAVDDANEHHAVRSAGSLEDWTRMEILHLREVVDQQTQALAQRRARLDILQRADAELKFGRYVVGRGRALAREHRGLVICTIAESIRFDEARLRKLAQRLSDGERHLEKSFNAGMRRGPAVQATPATPPRKIFATPLVA